MKNGKLWDFFGRSGMEQDGWELGLYQRKRTGLNDDMAVCIMAVMISPLSGFFDG